MAGITRSERQETVEEFINGSAQKVVLEKEPDNGYDPNAIKVIGKWKDQNQKEQEGMIGYIPKEVAAEISNKELLGCVNTIYKRTEKYNPGVKLDIYSVPSQETDNLIKPGTLDKKRRKEDTWTAYPLLVILTFGFPFIGIVLGIIGLAINKRGSWQLLLLGLVLWIVYALLLIEFWFSLFVI